MKKIADYVDGIRDEVNGAKEYANKYVEEKALSSNNGRASTYKKMANDELDHATLLHQMASEDIQEIRKVYPNPPTDMQEEWNKTHKQFVEEVSWVRQMLNM